VGKGWNGKLREIPGHLYKINPNFYLQKVIQWIIIVLMITVVELPEYIRKSEKLLYAEERDNFVEHIARNPRAGTLVTGTGGIRKIRWARKGMGKSGGVRIIYFFYNENIPVFLLTIFGKNEKTNLTKAERNELAKLTTLMVKSYKRGDK
jgi:hypothetical protein